MKKINKTLIASVCASLSLNLFAQQTYPNHPNAGYLQQGAAVDPVAPHQVVPTTSLAQGQNPQQVAPDYAQGANPAVNQVQPPQQNEAPVHVPPAPASQPDPVQSQGLPSMEAVFSQPNPTPIDDAPVQPELTAPEMGDGGITFIQPNDSPQVAPGQETGRMVLPPREDVLAPERTKTEETGASLLSPEQAQEETLRKKRRPRELRQRETAKSVIGVARLIDSESHKAAGLMEQNSVSQWVQENDEYSKMQRDVDISLFGSSRAERRLAMSWGIQDLPELPLWPDVVVPDEEMDKYKQYGSIQTYRPTAVTFRTDNMLGHSATQMSLNGSSRSLDLQVPTGEYGVWRHLRFYTYIGETKGLLLPLEGGHSKGLVPQTRKQWGIDQSGQEVEFETPHLCVDSKYLPINLDVAFLDNNNIVVDVQTLKAGSRVKYVVPDASSFESVTRSEYTLEETWKGSPPEVCSPLYTVIGSQLSYVILLSADWFQRAGLGPGVRAEF